MSRTIESSAIDSPIADPLAGVVERLLFLEKALNGAFDSLNQFDLSSKEAPITAVQKAGARIARHLGMHDLTFLVLLRDQSANVAGRIHLDNSPDNVQVELSNDLLNFPAAILSTLCHEITHKYLYLRNLVLPDERANEELTDTACVYLGLGTFMMEGCFCETTHYVPRGRTTRTLRTGYLSAEEFALTFALLEQIRPQMSRLSASLSDNAAARLDNARHMIRKRVLSVDARQDFHSAVLPRIDAAIRKRQQRDTRMRRALDAQPSPTFLKADRKAIHQRLRAYQSSQALLPSETRRSVVYLEACRILLGLDNLPSYSKAPFIWRLKSFYNRRISLGELGCPACEQRLRLGDECKASTIRCPRCKYQFLASV